MIEYPSEDDILNCTCCGRGIHNNAKENVSYGRTPYPHDNWYGLCRGCGGDSSVKTEGKTGKAKRKAIKKKLGWAASMFFEARFDTVRKALNEINQKKWDACSYEKKIAIVADFVEKGYMI